MSNLNQQFCDLCQRGVEFFRRFGASALKGQIKYQAPQGFDQNNPIHWLATGFGAGLTSIMRYVVVWPDYLYSILFRG